MAPSTTSGVGYITEPVIDWLWENSALGERYNSTGGLRIEGVDATHRHSGYVELSVTASMPVEMYEVLMTGRQGDDLYVREGHVEARSGEVPRASVTMDAGSGLADRLGVPSWRATGSRSGGIGSTPPVSFDPPDDPVGTLDGSTDEDAYELTLANDSTISLRTDGERGDEGDAD